MFQLTVFPKCPTTVYFYNNIYIQIMLGPFFDGANTVVFTTTDDTRIFISKSGSLNFFATVVEEITIVVRDH